MKKIFLFITILLSSSSYAITYFKNIPKNADGDITINETVYFESTSSGRTLRKLIIQNGGTLICSTGSTQSMYMNVSQIKIEQGGELRCGTINDRVQGKVEFRFQNYGECNDPNHEDCNARQILVDGGLLNLHGIDKGLSWTTLSQNTGADQDSSGDQIQLEDQVGEWVPGSNNDIVVVSSSTMNTVGHEVSRMSSKTNNSTWNLFRDLDNIHHGNSMTTVYGESMKYGGAAVGNLTRNILIRGKNCHYDDNGEVSNTAECNTSNTTEPGVDLIIQRSGGHHHHGVAGRAYIDSVEIAFGGKSGKLGRYPIHWHMVGSASGQYLKNSSIHNSINRCIVIHGTSNLLVENNVCFRHRGHGVFLEEGNETFNFIRRNLVMNSMVALIDNSNDGDNTPLVTELAGNENFARWKSPASFWVSNPKNQLINNMASGSQGVGFWMSYHGDTLYKKTPPDYFSYNRASATHIGFTWDGVDNGQGGIDPAHYSPRVSEVSNDENRSRSSFHHLIAYKNLESGIYFRGDAALFRNSLMVDNKWSFFVAYSQELRNSKIIGFSNKMINIDKSHLQQTTPSRTGGVVIYDGPFEMNRVTFENFNSEIYSQTTITPYPFFINGGHRKFINKTQGLTFTNVGVERVNLAFNPTLIDWRDSTISTMIKDLDGSLLNNGPTQNDAGKLIVYDEAHFYNNDPLCEARNPVLNGKVCPNNFQFVNYRFELLNNSNANANNDKISFGLKAAFGGTPWFNPYSPSKYMNKLSVLSAPTYVSAWRKHEVAPTNVGVQNGFSFANATKFRVIATTEGVLDQPAKIRINGKTGCSIVNDGNTNQITQAQDINEFHDTDGNVFYNHSTGLYLKMTGVDDHPWHETSVLSSVKVSNVIFHCP